MEAIWWEIQTKAQAMSLRNHSLRCEPLAKRSANSRLFAVWITSKADLHATLSFRSISHPLPTKNDVQPQLESYRSGVGILWNWIHLLNNICMSVIDSRGRSLAQPVRSMNITHFDVNLYDNTHTKRKNEFNISCKVLVLPTFSFSSSSLEH